MKLELRKSGKGRAGWQDAAGVVASGMLLVLMPKCPMCLAAYFALAGGISLSLAGYLRIALVVFGVAAMAFFASRLLHKFHLKHKHNQYHD